MLSHLVFGGDLTTRILYGHTDKRLPSSYLYQSLICYLREGYSHTELLSHLHTNCQTLLTIAAQFRSAYYQRRSSHLQTLRRPKLFHPNSQRGDTKWGISPSAETEIWLQKSPFGWHTPAMVQVLIQIISFKLSVGSRWLFHLKEMNVEHWMPNTVNNAWCGCPLPPCLVSFRWLIRHDGSLGGRSRQVGLCGACNNKAVIMPCK